LSPWRLRAASGNAPFRQLPLAFQHQLRPPHGMATQQRNRVARPGRAACLRERLRPQPPHQRCPQALLRLQPRAPAAQERARAKKRAVGARECRQRVRQRCASPVVARVGSERSRHDAGRTQQLRELRVLISRQAAVELRALRVAARRDGSTQHTAAPACRAQLTGAAQATQTHRCDSVLAGASSASGISSGSCRSLVRRPSDRRRSGDSGRARLDCRIQRQEIRYARKQSDALLAPLAAASLLQHDAQAAGGCARICRAAAAQCRAQRPSCCRGCGSAWRGGSLAPPAPAAQLRKDGAASPPPPFPPAPPGINGTAWAACFICLASVADHTLLY